MHIGSIVIDCNDFARMSAFWQEALHYVAREPADDGWVVLRDPDGVHVNVSIQQVPERASEKNRLHFDLDSTDQEAEVERLVGIGATRHPREPEPDEDLAVLADPEAISSA
jgi:hypothetical protein